jgi:hypothetical protein
VHVRAFILITLITGVVIMRVGTTPVVVMAADHEIIYLARSLRMARRVMKL